MHLHESAYIIHLYARSLNLNPDFHERHATPCPVCLSCLAGHEADEKKKISTKHAREPLSLTLSPPLP